MTETGSSAPVRVRSLVKRYGRTVALDGAKMEVPEGAFYLMVGPNGAGKTTLLKVLLGLVSADAGESEVLGRSPARSGARIRARVGYVPERQDAPYGWMRVDRMVRNHAAYHPRWDAAYAERLAEVLELRPRVRYGQLSKGQQRRVQILMALAHRPRLLILDEPTDGLDPVMRERVQELLADHLSESPTSVLVSTHIVHEMEQLADRLGVLSSGRVEAQVAREELHRSVRRYRIEVPDGWPGPEGLDGRLLRRARSGREVSLTVWGEEAAVSRSLAAGGATVRDVTPLSLEEAALAFMDPRKEA